MKEDLEHIAAHFSYDKSTGVLSWAMPKKRVTVGRPVGCVNTGGYLTVGLNKKRYQVHRIVWLIHHGKWPDGVIDHINGITNDNRIENLRDTTTSENAQNQRRARKDNISSGLLGAYYVKHRGNWQAQITLNGKAKHLGVFKTAQEAHEAYLKAKREMHPMCTI